MYIAVKYRPQNVFPCSLLGSLFMFLQRVSFFDAVQCVSVLTQIKPKCINWSIWFLHWHGKYNCEGFFFFGPFPSHFIFTVNKHLLPWCLHSTKYKPIVPDSWQKIICFWTASTLVSSWRQLLVLVRRWVALIWHDDNYEVVLASPKMSCMWERPNETSIMRGA